MPLPSFAVSDHFDGREFRNLGGVPAGRSLADVLRWKFRGGGNVTPWPPRTDTDFITPALPASIADGELAATFVGHSTFLLQFAHGVNILTDPIWSERASPVSFAGPRRARRPGLSMEALPPVGLVLVSHAHYDHLDLPTLRRLDKQFRPLFLAGLGHGEFLRRNGLRNVEELDWWQSFRFAGLEITFTPAQHWTARGPIKRNTMLWGGFWMRRDVGEPVYFAGDSGFGPPFQAVRERLGAPGVAFLPIGAYEPRWFMRKQHMNPDEAVQAHLILEARRSVGMHFGTFRLTDEGIDAPAGALSAALLARGVDPAAFCVPQFGETIRVRAPSES